MRKAISAGLAVLSVAAIGSVSIAGATPVARPAAQGVRSNAITPAVSAGLIGGGATLPVFAYTGQGSQPNGTLITTFTTGSAFGVSGNVQSYCVTGSGTGRKVLELGNVSTCGTTNGKANQGFSTVAGVPKFPDFAASDAPFGSSDITNFYAAGGANASGYGDPVQVPAVVGAIAIAIHYSGTIPSGGVTAAAVCGVFNGSVSTWNGLLGNGDNTAIGQLYYRGDSSGTSFSFTNWLTSNCATRSIGGVAKQFNVDSTFANAIAAFSSLPADFNANSPQQGNGGVKAALDSTNNSVGYVEAAYAIGDTSIHFLKIGNKDPIASLPATGKALSFSTTTTCTGGNGVAHPQLVTGFSLDSDTLPANGGYKPSLVAITTGNNGADLLLVNPCAYSKPGAGYPIVAVSNLDSTTKGSGTRTSTKATAIQNLFKEFAPLNASITTIDKPNAIGNGKTGFTTPNPNSVYTAAVAAAANSITFP